MIKQLTDTQRNLIALFADQNGIDEKKLLRFVQSIRIEYDIHKENVN